MVLSVVQADAARSVISDVHIICDV